MRGGAGGYVIEAEASDQDDIAVGAVAIAGETKL